MVKEKNKINKMSIFIFILFPSIQRGPLPLHSKLANKSLKKHALKKVGGVVGVVGD
jgi:hypothetical protein